MPKFIKNIILIAFGFCVFLSTVACVHAQTNSKPQTETLEGVITKIIQQKQINLDGKKQIDQTLEILITNGSLKDRKITVESGDEPISNNQIYQVKDEVIVTYDKNVQGTHAFYISDYIRRLPLLILSIIFIVLVIVVGGYKGIASLISLFVSFYFIINMIIPQIADGTNPIVIVILAFLFIIPITFYLTHGLNRKTTVAIVGTFIALIIASGLTVVFSDMMNLTGFISDESSFAQLANSAINMKDILMAGMMIGVLGVINDITVSQSAIVFQLREANDRLSWRELYKRALNVGQDHIGSMVNTLILVYAGASLPLFLLFANNPQPFTQVVNYEIVAVELLRALIGSITLVIAVPLTSLIASIVASKNR